MFCLLCIERSLPPFVDKGSEIERVMTIENVLMNTILGNKLEEVIDIQFGVNKILHY